MVTERSGAGRATYAGPAATFENPAIDELRAAIEARDQLLAVVGHELRNSMAPLTLLVSMFEAMPTADDIMKGKVAMIARNLRGFRDTLERVTEITQLRTGKLTLRREQVDLDEVVREVCAEAAAQRAIEIRIDSRSIAGRWDRGRIRQVASHLLSNAIRYGEGPIDVIVRPHRHDVQLVVHDAGPGVAPELREHLFDLFERKGPRRRGGLGVGLWVVKQLCNAMGGSVSLDASERGARFSVVLPRD